MINPVSHNNANYLNLANAFYEDCIRRRIHPTTAKEYRGQIEKFFESVKPAFCFD